jgi:hypothetical protein
MCFVLCGARCLSAIVFQLGRRINAGDLPEGYFINGDSVVVISKSMVLPTNQLKRTNFDHEQSSNRMCIEYVLGSPSHNPPPT